MNQFIALGSNLICKFSEKNDNNCIYYIKVKAN